MKCLTLILVMLHLVSIFGCSASSSEENKAATNVQSNSHNDSQVKSQNNAQSDMSMIIYTTNIPLTSDYYNQFMDSQIEFPVIVFDYGRKPTLEYPDSPNKSLLVQSKIEVVAGQFTDFTLSQLDEFHVFYKDIAGDPMAVYEADLESNWILPIFTLIDENSDFYLNGVEYNGEESLKLTSNLQFGYNNYIYLGIENPNRTRGIINPFYAFCKGWDPGEDPPAELVPLIDYLESVLIPEMMPYRYE